MSHLNEAQTGATPLGPRRRLLGPFQRLDAAADRRVGDRRW
jgi:hypothetical protein